MLTLLVLDLGLDVVNGVAGLDLQSDGLASQSLDEDLHATAQTEHQVECGLFLDVVVSQRAAILQLLASKDQALLVGRNACDPIWWIRYQICRLIWPCLTAACSEVG